MPSLLDSHPASRTAREPDSSVSLPPSPRRRVKLCTVKGPPAPGDCTPRNRSSIDFIHCALHAYLRKYSIVLQADRTIRDKFTDSPDACGQARWASTIAILAKADFWAIANGICYRTLAGNSRHGIVHLSTL